MADLFQSLRPQSPSDPGTLLPLGKATLEALTPDYMKQPTGPVMYPSTPGKMATVDPAADAFPMAMIDAASMIPTGGAVKGLGLAALHLLPKAIEEQTFAGGKFPSKLFHILNDAGDAVGSADLAYSPELKRIWVHSIEGDFGPQSFGTAEMRSLLGALKKEFPDAESVAGVRISGARKATAGRSSERVEMRLPE